MGESLPAGVADAVNAAPAWLACPGKRLPDGLLVDCCLTCTRTTSQAVTLSGILEAAARFVETGDRIGWQCVNRRGPA